MAKFPLIVTGVLVVAGVTGAAISYRRRRAGAPVELFGTPRSTPAPKPEFQQFEMAAAPTAGAELLTAPEPVGVPSRACA